MLFDEIDPECRASVICDTVDFVNSAPAPVRCGGIAAELEASANRNRNAVSYVDFVKHHKGLAAPGPFGTNGVLTSQKWHQPYAEALMEVEPAKRAPLIAEAERAIFGRYLELCVTPAAIEHSIDLQNAVYYLMQLKDANSR
ncbi:MAG: hypothetical protein WAK48_18235 [Candidatus Acidiferrum sp.]|jgi:hypothetical protein